MTHFNIHGPDIADAFRGIRRVVQSNGKLIFFELGISPDPVVQRWEKRLEPVHQWLFQGLYLTRYIPSLLTEEDFQIEEMRVGYVASFPKPSTYSR